MLLKQKVFYNRARKTKRGLPMQAPSYYQGRTVQTACPQRFLIGDSGGFRNMKYGHFDNEKREYVIDRVDLPTSWTNYLGVKDMCAVLNHTAGGYIFYKSPEYHRITRFRANAVPMDRPGHYVSIRDDEDGDYWTTAASRHPRKCASPKRTRWNCGM